MLNTLRTLQAMPRDSRDTLFLLGVIGWILLPHVGNLPVWCSALAAAMLAWRGWLAATGRPLPGIAWRIGLLALTLVATLATHRTLLGRDAGVTLIVVLLALKTLELRARRDAFVVFFLGFFTMLTHFFFSQSLLTAAAMLIGLLGLLTALVNAHMPAGRPSLGAAFRTAGTLALFGTPVMVALFMLFPRIGPLWGLPSDAMSGRSGLSATMTVGHIAQLALDETVALRVRFQGRPPPQSDLYFRGPVLAHFDGRTWQPQPLRHDSPPAARLLSVSGAPVRYEVTMEPSKQPWLFLLEAATDAPALPGYGARLTPDLQWLANRPVTDLVRYQATSYPSYRLGPSDALARTTLRQFVDLPPGFNPRTLQLAADMRADVRLADARTTALVGAVLERLRNGGYRYTLEPGVSGPHSADEFWFDTREGFCEHIASAFVVLMRALGVPARVVTGYQGGTLNSLDGYWEVRQSDAHAWAEVWEAGRGWVRVDPTAAVAPGRTGTAQRLQVPRGVIAQALVTLSPDLLAQLRQGWNALNNRWNQWVLNYTQNRQMDLLRQLGFDTPDWQDLSLLLIALAVAASLAGAAWTLWERRQHDPWLRLLARARRRLAAAGLPLPPNASPREMGQLVRALPATQDTGTRRPALTPDQAQKLHAWLLRLERWRYAPPPSPTGPATPSHHDTLAALRREFRHLPWPPPCRNSSRLLFFQ